MDEGNKLMVRDIGAKKPISEDDSNIGNKLMVGNSGAERPIPTENVRRTEWKFNPPRLSPVDHRDLPSENV